jgi:hypothetical protein
VKVTAPPDVSIPPPKRRRRWPRFALVAVLGIVALTTHGAVAAASALAAMIGFIGACIHALGSEDPDTVEHNKRTNLSGWFGGGF